MSTTSFEFKDKSLKSIIEKHNFTYTFQDDPDIKGTKCLIIFDGEYPIASSFEIDYNVVSQDDVEQHILKQIKEIIYD